VYKKQAFFVSIRKEFGRNLLPDHQNSTLKKMFSNISKINPWLIGPLIILKILSMPVAKRGISLQFQKT
jgi:hypothetical protein